MGESLKTAGNHLVWGFAVPPRSETSIATKDWTLLALKQWGYNRALWRALGLLPPCICFLVLSNCQYFESRWLGLGTKDFCLNLKIFKIKKWQLQVMTGHTIAVEIQQETLRAYTRVFAFLVLSVHILLMGGWKLWCQDVQECVGIQSAVRSRNWLVPLLRVNFLWLFTVIISKMLKSDKK